MPTLLDWPLGSAGVAGLELALALEVEECTMAGSCTLRLLAVVVHRTFYSDCSGSRNRSSSEKSITGLGLLELSEKDDETCMGMETSIGWHGKGRDAK